MLSYLQRGPPIPLRSIQSRISCVMNNKQNSLKFMQKSKQSQLHTYKQKENSQKNILTSSNLFKLFALAPRVFNRNSKMSSLFCTCRHTCILSMRLYKLEPYLWLCCFFRQETSLQNVSLYPSVNTC